MSGHASKVLKIFGDQMGRYIRMALIMAAIAGGLVFIGTAAAKVLINQWRREYNQIRPHSARKLSTTGPGSHFSRDN
jgi:predicted PurR-regulated permease PerM